MSIKKENAASAKLVNKYKINKMHYRISRILLFISLFFFTLSGFAQEKSNSEKSDKPVILYSATPKKYEIGGITVSGVKDQEDFLLIGLSGLSVGQVVSVPGDEITQAVKRYMRHVGVLATSGTINSGSYPLEIHKLYPEIVVSGEACPMWVPLVENKEYDSPGADYFVKKHIENLIKKDTEIDTIILGCTHYPLLLTKINQFLPKGITVVSQGEYVAESLKSYLRRHPEMDTLCTKNGKYKFITTESETKFSESASAFLNEEISVEKVVIE